MKYLSAWSFLLLSFSLAAPGATISASSCSDQSVQTAINSASKGDTVLVPAGNCTWASTVSIGGKSLALQGGGIGQTNITDNGSGGAALTVSASAANFVRLTGFTFIKSAAHSSGIIQIYGVEADVAFRFDHIRILQASSGSRGIVITGVYGLIDHCAFDVTATSGSIQSISIWGASDGGDGGFTAWTRPLTLGTEKAVYVEDSTITYSSHDESCSDTYGGARWVFRHNTITGCEFGGGHGFDSGNRRSLFSGEIYENQYINDYPPGGSSTLRAGTFRGGTGVVFNNTYGGTHGSWYGIALMNYRSCPPLDQSAWQTCDGTKLELGSMNLSTSANRTASSSGGVKWCSGARDVMCTADSTCSAIGAGTCSTYLDGSGTQGYPCRDQIGRTHNQELAPLYVWNNGGVEAGTYDAGNACGVGIDQIIMLNRDYYVGTPMPGYAPYTYPHPLQGQAGTPISEGPVPPSNVAVSSIK